MTNIAHERLITNKLMLNHLDMWDEFDIKSVDDNKTVRYYNRIMNHINDEIEAGLKWLDSEEAEKYFKEESQYHHKVFQSLEDEWDSILESKYDSIEALLSEVYQRGKAKGYTDMQEHVRYTEADKLALEFVKNYNFDLIRRIDNDVRNEIKNKIISGFLAGDNPNLIAPKIQAIAGEQLEGSTFTPRQRATMIAKTEVSRVQNTGMLQSYVNEGYTEVKILTAEDNNVCATCLEYAYDFNKDDDLIYGNHGKEKIHNIIELIKGGSFPPFHPNCRCTYLSVWKTKTKPPKKPYIIDLTPDNYPYEKILYRFMDDGTITNLKGFDDDKWTKESIYKSLKGFVDAEDLDGVSKAILVFIQNARKHPKEGITTYDNKFNPISKFIPGDSEKFIDIPQEDINQVKNSYFGLVGHSHPLSKIPLPDLEDILYGNLTINSKYNIIYAPGFGVTVIKHTKPKNKPDKTSIEDSYKEANDKRKEYVNNNIARVTEEYKKAVKNNYKISLLKQRRDIYKIKDEVRHNNFDKQCKFYNDEFKKYGINLMYIKP